MKAYQLNQDEIKALLNRTMTGVLSTINQDGTPYSIPVHFAVLNERIYIYGMPNGKKIDNIKNNPNVCFIVYEMNKLVFSDEKNPCTTNTEYISVVMQGTAMILDNYDEKKEALNAIVAKYTPQLVNEKLPSNTVNHTTVLQIAIEMLSGKHHK